MVAQTSSMRAMRKTRSMQPSRLPFTAVGCKVTKPGAKVGKTWEGTFQASIDDLQLDKELPMMGHKKRQRIGDHLFSSVNNQVTGSNNAVQTNAGHVFRSTPAEVCSVYHSNSFSITSYQVNGCNLRLFVHLPAHSCGVKLHKVKPL
jgi:hypothetical protein